MGFSRQEYWSGLPFPFPVDHILSDLSTMTHPSWVALRAWLNLIELDKTVVLVWLDWLVFCEYRFSVSALWCPLATPTILLEFLLPWVWGISSRLLQQSTATAPYLGWGIPPPATLPDLQCWMAPLGPPVPAQPPLLGLLLPAAGPGLGLGVAPQGHHPWPRARGGFSLLPLTSDAGCLLPAATDLGRGVAPSGRSCAIAAWHSRPLPMTSDVG